MTSQPFLERVNALRTAWDERRCVERLAAGHDFASQYGLLLLIHRWVADAVADAVRCYGQDLPISLSPAPPAAGRDTAFHVMVAGTFSLVFGLVERHREGGPSWSVALVERVAGPIDDRPATGPSRGRWTRARVEELMLSLLGAFERARSEESRGHAFASSSSPGEEAGQA